MSSPPSAKRPKLTECADNDDDENVFARYHKSVDTFLNVAHDMALGELKFIAMKNKCKELKQRLKDAEDRLERSRQTPLYVTCPITHTLMHDPVVAADGHTYERQAIERWFGEGNTTSPLTGAHLASSELRPNFAIKAAIAACEANQRPLATLFDSSDDDDDDAQ